MDDSLIKKELTTEEECDVGVVGGNRVDFDCFGGNLGRQFSSLWS